MGRNSGRSSQAGDPITGSGGAGCANTPSSFTGRCPSAADLAAWLWRADPRRPRVSPVRASAEGPVAMRRQRTKEPELPIVTISRQFGAGGSSVAAIVAAELGAEIVDKKLIDEVAGRLTLEPSQVEAEAERPRPLLERLVRWV